MITNGYDEKKQQVLALYERYAELCKRAGKTVDKSIAAEAKAIRDDVFNLMVLGEAKSGKSTFINAYLGCEVVPMDVRQCTSAIIKIHGGTPHLLIAQEAGGNKQIIRGEDKIQAFLKKHAALSDKYRDIPVTAINSELLTKFRDKKIPKADIDEFIKQMAGNNGNFYKLEPQEYAQKIRKYIADNASGWAKIITEIDITWPLDDAMKNITIVDSPGVNAGGSAGSATEKNIDKADAIIFTKSLVGQAVESKPFMDFMRNNCSRHKRDCLFLVCTGKANLSSAEAASLREQAADIFKKDISEDKIIFIDSKIQLLLNNCLRLGNIDSINDFFDKLESSGNADSVIRTVMYHWGRSKFDISQFTEKMEEVSNFQKLNKALDKFARVAHYHKLADFLANLEIEYKRHIDTLKDKIELTQQNIKHPAALEDCVKKKQSEIDDISNKINEGIEKIYKKYLDPVNSEGIIDHEIAKKSKEYLQIIDSFYDSSKNADGKNTAKTDDLKSNAEKLAADAERKKDEAKNLADEANQKEEESHKIRAEAAQNRAAAKKLTDETNRLKREASKLNNEAEQALAKAKEDSNRHKACVNALNYGATPEMKSNAEKTSKALLRAGEKRKAELIFEAEKKIKEADKKWKQAAELRLKACQQTNEADKLWERATLLRCLQKTKINESQQFQCNYCSTVTSNNAFSVMKRKTMDIIEDVKAFREETAKRIIADFNTRLIQYANNTSMISANIFKPNFTAADFDRINKDAAQSSLEIQKINEGKTFSDTEKRVPSYHLNKHVSHIANDIRNRLSSNIIPTMKNNLIDYITACRSQYKSKLDERMKELKKEYDQLLVDKDNNEKQIQLINNMQEQLKLSKQELNVSERLKKEINDYAAARG